MVRQIIFVDCTDDNLITLPDTDIIHLQFPTGSMVILDSVQAAQDLFEKRSYQYSDRARSFILEK